MPFDAYKQYLSLKNHFTKEKYDYHKYCGKSRSTVQSFYKRKDRFWFEKLARNKDDKEVVDFFVSKVGRGLYWNLWLLVTAAFTVMWSISRAAVLYRTCENKLDYENDWMVQHFWWHANSHYPSNISLFHFSKPSSSVFNLPFLILNVRLPALKYV